MGHFSAQVMIWTKTDKALARENNMFFINVNEYEKIIRDYFNNPFFNTM
jgi:hypothetical protein